VVDFSPADGTLQACSLKFVEKLDLLVDLVSFVLVGLFFLHECGCEHVLFFNGSDVLLGVLLDDPVLGLGDNIDLHFAELVQSLVGVVGEDSREADLAGSGDSFLELLLVDIVLHFELFNCGEVDELFIGDNEEPVVLLEVGVVLAVDIAGLHSLRQVLVLDLHLTSQDVSNDDLVFSFDESGHGELHNGKSVNAFFLFFVYI